jgi:hypothetical protein
MSAYIAGLKAAAERDRTRKDEQERAVAVQATQAARERLTSEASGALATAVLQPLSRERR